MNWDDTDCHLGGVAVPIRQNIPCRGPEPVKPKNNQHYIVPMQVRLQHSDINSGIYRRPRASLVNLSNILQGAFKDKPHAIIRILIPSTIYGLPKPSRQDNHKKTLLSRAVVCPGVPIYRSDSSKQN